MFSREGASAMVLTLVSAQPALANPADEAAVRSTIESVAVLADRGEFTTLERVYAPEVRVDYSSLSGGKPEVKSNVALMTEWANVLPGFDRTRHQLSNVRVQLSGDSARATADVVADHWAGSQVWRVAGRYDYTLVRDGRDWRITAHRFDLGREQGSRQIFATATAKARPNAYIVRQQARATVLDFLEGLETKDMARVNGVWAEDAVQDMPFSPPGHPKRVTGRAALIDLYKAWPTVSGKAEFTDGIVFHPTLDPEIVAVEYNGRVEVIPTGRTYRQTYFGLFHIDDGKISLFREYYDPAAFAWAFRLPGAPEVEPQGHGQN